MPPRLYRNTQSGDYTQTFTAVNGCDSVVTLHLTIYPSVTELVEATTADSCYLWNDVEYCTSGDYTQTLQTVHGCDSVVTLHLTITVGIDDHDLSASMTVYPNPTNGVVHVQWTLSDGSWKGAEIQVVDMYGRLLDVVATNHGTSLQPAQLDLSGFANGVYFIKLVADDKTVAACKVVKQ